MARLIHKQRTSNKAEIAMLGMLMELPDCYTVITELRIAAPAFVKRTSCLRKTKQPDFIVAGHDLGIVSIEVKDWDIEHNTYRWPDQQTVLKSGCDEPIDNPWHQAHIYEKALQELLRGYGIWVSSFVAFPRLDRSRFFNLLSSPGLVDDDQAVMMMDPSKTLFGSDTRIRSISIDSLLRLMVQQANPAMKPVNDETMDKALSRLIPSEFKVGDATQRVFEEREALRLLTERQQRMAFSLPIGRHVIFDLAGSGKTNVLVSRAIDLSSRLAKDGRQPRILILTYSFQLATAIRQMLRSKLGSEPEPAGLEVADIETLLFEIVSSELHTTHRELRELLQERSSEQSFRALVGEFQKMGPGLSDRYRVYDAIFVDEIQDYTRITEGLIGILHRGEELFLVGDIAQRIHQRDLELNRLNIDLARARVKGQYCMYRCPVEISQAAHKLVMKDPSLADELRNHGYGTETCFDSRVHSLPECSQLNFAEDLPAAVCKVYESNLALGVAPKDMMIVTSADCLPGFIKDLSSLGIPVKAAPDDQNAVLVTDFVMSKGLEAEVVVITRIEDLPAIHRRSVGDCEDGLAGEASLSRRKLYAAMTRTKRRLVVFYEDRHHPLVSDLLECTTKVSPGLGGLT